MATRGKAWITPIALALLLPASAVMASGGVGNCSPSATAGQSHATAIMVEGRVLTVSGADFAMETPAEGVFCRPPMMCPDILRAPVRYEVDANEAKVFGAYFGEITLQDVRPGSLVVVYGTLTMAHSSPIGAVTQTVAGWLQAQGIFLLSPAGRSKPWPIYQKPVGPIKSPTPLP